MADQKLTPDIQEILEASTFSEDGTLMKLPGQLPPEVYKKVDIIIKMLDGVWKKNRDGHLFPRDVREMFQVIYETKIVPDFKKRRQAYYTPKEVAEQLVAHAFLEGNEVLEPSVGGGVLADLAIAEGANVTCYEIDPFSVEELKGRGYNVTQADFLTVAPDPKYDTILMNPPFNKGQDMKHVDHALKFLAPHGRLYAIVSPSFKLEKFREYVETYGVEGVDLEEVEAGAFKESGTTIATQILRIRTGLNTKTSRERAIAWRSEQMAVGLIHGDVGAHMQQMISKKKSLPEIKEETLRRVSAEIRQLYRTPGTSDPACLIIPDDIVRIIEENSYKLLDEYFDEEKELYGLATSTGKATGATGEAQEEFEEESPEEGDEPDSGEHAEDEDIEEDEITEDEPAPEVPAIPADLARPTLLVEQHYLFNSVAGDVAETPNGNLLILGHFDKKKNAVAFSTTFNETHPEVTSTTEGWLTGRKNPGKTKSMWSAYVRNVTQDLADSFKKSLLPTEGTQAVASEVKKAYVKTTTKPEVSTPLVSETPATSKKPGKDKKIKEADPNQLDLFDMAC